MAFAKGFTTFTLGEILEKTTELSILSYYLGIYSIPCLIKSPLREDKNPSFSIYMKNTGKVAYIDFGTGDHGNLYTLLMKLYDKSFKEVIAMIADNLPSLKTNCEVRDRKDTQVHSIHHITSSTIQVKFREWRDYDLKYWESFGISLPWLKFGDIYPISQIFFTKEGVTRAFPAGKYGYAYIERKDNNPTIKIYQPFCAERKWISKHDASVWDLWTKIPQYGEDLIITSSRKDALCIWENTGIPSVSLQGEGYVPKEQVVSELKGRYKNVFILYDNDFNSEVNHGRYFGKNLSEKFNLIQIEIPEEYKAKDTSDLCKLYGRKCVNEVINNLVYAHKDDLPF